MSAVLSVTSSVVPSTNNLGADRLEYSSPVYHICKGSAMYSYAIRLDIYSLHPESLRSRSPATGEAFTWRMDTSSTMMNKANERMGSID